MRRWTKTRARDSRATYNHARDRRSFCSVENVASRMLGYFSLGSPQPDSWRFISHTKFEILAGPFGPFKIPSNKVYIRKTKPENEIFQRMLVSSFPVDIGQTSMLRYNGNIARHNGSKVSKDYPQVPAALKYCNSEHIDSVYRRDISNDVVLSECETNYQQGIGEFSKNKSSLNPRGDRYTVNAVAKVVDKLYMPGNPMGRIPVPLDVYSVKSPVNSLPGGEWNLVFGNKREAFATAASIAEKILGLLLSGESLDMSFITTMAGKSKASRNKDSWESLASRPLEQEDMVLMIIGKVLIHEFEEYISRSYMCPIKIGDSTTNEGMERALFSHRCYPFAIEADAKAHDASVTDQEIGAAFSVIRGYYPPSDNLDNAFHHVASWMSSRNMVLESGTILGTLGGMPTGTFGTCIINSLVTCVRIERIMSEFATFKQVEDYDYSVLGDDVVLYFDRKVRFSNLKLINWIHRRMGFQWGIERKGSPITDDPDTSITFLKHTMCCVSGEYVVGVPPGVLLKRLSVPSYTRVRTARDYVDYLEANIATNSSFTETANVFAGLLVYARVEAGDLPADIDYLSQIDRTATDLQFISLANNNSRVEGTHYPILNANIRRERSTCVEVNENFPVDTGFVDNWLYDNGDRKFFMRPSKEQRYRWLVKQKGKRLALESIVDVILGKSVYDIKISGWDKSLLLRFLTSFQGIEGKLSVYKRYTKPLASRIQILRKILN
jgi:hypothetical protein